jgi:hypothetical protein
MGVRDSAGCWDSGRYRHKCEHHHVSGEVGGEGESTFHLSSQFTLPACHCSQVQRFSAFSLEIFRLLSVVTFKYVLGGN